MRRLRPTSALAAAALVAAAALPWGAGACRAGDAAPAATPADAAEAAEGALRRRLLRDLSAEAAAVRESALRRLDDQPGLTADEVADAFRGATPQGRTALVGLAARLGMQELTPQLVAAAIAPDRPCAEAAIRALVTLGGPALDAGRAALRTGGEGAADGAVLAARSRHLQALDVQRRVEADVLSRWRRKGGSYRGRYAALRSFGWDAQPVLLAMLLDVPLEDQFVVVGDAGDPQLDGVRRAAALREIARSKRRGYRTFDPLPPTIELDEVFSLAEQALADVADLDLMQDVLDDTHRRLYAADEAGGWRPRRTEEAYAQAIEVVLSHRGAPERLEARFRSIAADLSNLKLRVGRRAPEDAAIEYQVYATKLTEMASVLHLLGRFDEAADGFERVIEIIRDLTDSEPALQGYNRACALTRGGHTDEAIEQLARALDPAISSGTEDLTREWISEDGDLEPLHRDPRWAGILKRRFGP